MSKRALITGVNGMDGSHLADLLLSKGYKVYGMERRVSTPVRRNSQHLVGEIEFITGDLTDPRSLADAIDVSFPDEVYNLAAQSFVGSSWAIPNQTSEVNAIGVLNLLEAVRVNKPDAKFYQASTSEMYGNHISSKANEQTPFNPRSPYGVSKLFAHHMTNNYRDSYNMFTCCGILFNHESERRGIEFVTRKITDGVARIVSGKADHITLGNLDARRDWGYAPDYVEAMWLMLQRSDPDNYVISTGVDHSVRDFVEKAFLSVGIREWEKYIIQDKQFMRPAEINTLRGDSSNAKYMLNWTPKTTFHGMVDKMIDNDLSIHNG
jgi:GDPmannose 4,6-dehydratase